VSGLLWLLDQMVEAGVIPRRKARLSLQAILDRGARLPEDECTARLCAWG
jgi:hypothetical protein